MESGTKPLIGAVMVLYHPDFDVTGKAIDALLPQVDLLCLVDNTPGSDSSRRFRDCSDIVYVPLGDNRGIAAAQNEGIRRLLERGVGFILFTDQDSLPEPDVVKYLTDAYSLLSGKQIAVAAIGTRAYNCETGRPYAPKSRETGIPPELKDMSDCGITEAYSVRSSISLLPVEALRLNGGFDEALFIDGVDHEWGWRAWHFHGLRSFLVEKARITHHLGEGDRRLGTHKVSIPAVFRVYYQFRNYLWLRRLDYTPSAWKHTHALKYTVKSFYFPIMVSPRLKYLKNILKGIHDGLRTRHPSDSFPRF